MAAATNDLTISQLEYSIIEENTQFTSSTKDNSQSEQPSNLDTKLPRLPSQHPTSTPLPTQIAVPVPTRTPQPVAAPHELDHWFTTYGTAFNVDPNALKGIAQCESGFNPNSQSGPYGGMFQYMASTWSSTRNAMGLDPNPDLRFNAEEAIKTSAWKISVGGIGAWPHCGRQFAAGTISK